MKLFLGISRDATTVWRSSLFAVRLAALVMGSVAFSGVLWVTEPAGPGLQAASAAYLGAAESLVAGHGYRVPTATWADPDSTPPLTRYPPGFSTAIAVPVWSGLPAAQAARLVEALSAFVAMAVLVAIVGDAAGAGAAVLLGFALLVMPMMVDLHLSVLSEPLFLALVSLTLAAMVAAPDAVVVAGLCAALALSVRYAGVAVVGAVVLWTLLRSGTWKVRVRRAALAALPAVLIGGSWWWIVRRAAAVSAGPGPLDAVGATPGTDLIAPLAGGGATVARWLVPTTNRAGWALWVAVPAAVAVAALVVMGTRRAYRLWRLLPRDLPLSSSTNVPQLVAARLLAASGLLGVSYLGMLVAAQIFTDRSISLSGRILSPLVMLLSAAIAVAGANWWRSAGRLARGGMLAVLLLWGGGSLAVSHAHAHEALTSGFDLANDVWRRSSLVEWVRNDGNRRPVYTNWPTVSYFYLGRPARGLPATTDAATLRAFGDTLAARGGGGGGVILAFSAANPAYVPADSLIAALGLSVLATYPDGRVLAAPLPPAPAP